MKDFFKLMLGHNALDIFPTLKEATFLSTLLPFASQSVQSQALHCLTQELIEQVENVFPSSASFLSCTFPKVCCTVVDAQTINAVRHQCQHPLGQKTTKRDRERVREVKEETSAVTVTICVLFYPG